MEYLICLYKEFNEMKTYGCQKTPDVSIFFSCKVWFVSGERFDEKEPNTQFTCLLFRRYSSIALTVLVLKFLFTL